MTEAVIRARIDTVVSAVSNVGQVYDYIRTPKVQDTWSEFLDLYKTTIGGNQVIRGWTITCESIAPSELIAIGSEGSDTQLNYVFKVRGFFGIDDENESEKTAIAIVEDVVIALNGDSTLRDYYGSGPQGLAECTIFEPREYGDVLCHYAEISLPVQERDES